ILIINRSELLNCFQQIFVLAFRPQAMAGGVAGVTVKTAMRFGVARGLFSNEAGMGSTPHAHALAKVKHPQEQGVIAMMGVFIDTFVILTLTALVILSSGTLASGEEGTALAQLAFNQAFGAFGNIFIAICMLFFAFSTIIGWYFFGQVNVKALLGEKAVRVYSVIVVLFVVVGSALKVDLVWNLSDLFNGLMVIPNLIALLALSGLVARISKE
ncbi:alanine:cation symporter family protein, partial [uncultured Ruthenibacterium sp.]|uniref:alanine:cation symporter family protein n=1 Tax=uncultured Ruthenibacterium sp. TaxID=1905347 RepID=UPI00349E4AD9